YLDRQAADLLAIEQDADIDPADIAEAVVFRRSCGRDRSARQRDPAGEDHVQPDCLPWLQHIRRRVAWISQELDLPERVDAIDRRIQSQRMADQIGVMDYE